MGQNSWTWLTPKDDKGLPVTRYNLIDPTCYDMEGQTRFLNLRTWKGVQSIGYRIPPEPNMNPAPGVHQTGRMGDST